MRLSPFALAASMALSAASCGGHDPLLGWQVPDAAGDRVAAFDQAVDLSQPVRPDASQPDRPFALDLGRDLSPDASTLGSGLDRARLVSSLSDVELGRLCDWGLGQLGGYGTTSMCIDGTQIRNAASQQACIAGHDRSFRCTASVGESEDCLKAVATMGCSQALFFGTPACQAMFTCQRA